MSEVLLPAPLGLAMPPWVTPASRCSLGLVQTSFKSGGAGAAVAWGTNNDIIYYPFQADQPFWVRRIGWVNGATVAGNIDVGLFNASFVKLLSTGSTAQSGTSVTQIVDVTDTLFQPDRYYVGTWASDATATLYSISALTGALYGRWAGLAQENSASLPSTATPVTYAKTFIPLAGLSQRDTA